MKILFYRYGSICEPDIIECFKAAGIEVYEESSMIMRKNITASETVEQLSALLKSDTYLFVFSINFFPAVSETCNIYNIPYVCWTVDSPIMELFSPSLKNKCNRIFFFDRMQYEYFRQNTEGCCFHLPLATNVSRLDNAILSASTGDQKLYSGDISLVGSLYSEKNPYSKIQGLSEKTKGYIDGILEAQKNVYGYYFVENVLREDIMQEFRVKVPDLTKSPYSQYFDDRYVMAHFFIGMELAERERKEILSALSEKYDTHLYTQSDASMLKSVKVHEGVKH